MFRVVRIRVERSARFEIGDQDSIARVVNLADVKPHIQAQQSWDQTSKTLERRFDARSRFAALARGLTRNTPHYDVPDHYVVSRIGFNLTLHTTILSDRQTLKLTIEPSRVEKNALPEKLISARWKNVWRQTGARSLAWLRPGPARRHGRLPKVYGISEPGAYARFARKRRFWAPRSSDSPDRDS